MKLLKGLAVRGKIAVAAFVLAIGAGACGALLPQTHAAFAESETQVAVPASTEEQLEQTPRIDGDEDSQTLEDEETKEPTVVEKPKLVGESSFSYDGKPHRFGIEGYTNTTVGYMSYTLIAPEGTVEEIVLGNTVTFEVSEVGDYQVTFLLGDNYVFDNGDTSETIEFSITQATDQTVTIEKEYCVAYGEKINIVPTVKYTEGNVITTSYYTYSGNASAPVGESLGNAVPVHAGNYYVVVSVAGTGNYAQATAGAVVVIEKKELKVTITAHTYYGQRIAAEDVAIDSIEGFAYSDTADSCVSVNLDLLAQGITYGEGTGPASVGKYTPEFAWSTTTINAYKSKTANTLRGFSKKGDANNYYFTAAVNCRVHVSKLPVSVVIGNASGSFSTIPQYNSGITLRWADSAANKKIPEVDKNKQDDELKKLLNVTSSSFHCTASATSDVDKYPIRIVKWENANYDVTFVDGIYEIVPTSLVVEWNEGGGSYRNVVAPEILSINALIGNGLQPPSGEFAQSVREGLSFRFTDLTGNQSIEPGEVPVNAGNYSVELTFTTEGKIGRNFVLSSKSASPRQFTVNKLMLDVEELRLDDGDGKLEYNNGDAVVPTLLQSGFEEYFDVAIDEAKVVGTYYVTYTIKDFDNVQWSTGKTAEYKLPFNVVKAKNKIIGSIYIEGWTYGETAKKPSVMLAVTKDISEDIDILPSFEYSSDVGANWTSVVPKAAGNYLVRTTTKGTTNVEAFASLSATFSIERKAIEKPRLVVSTANNSYTGEDLYAKVSGFDQTLMMFTYTGNFTVEGNDIALTVRNAGDYTLSVELFDTNYVWSDGDEEKVYKQVWTVAPKRIAKPSAGNNVFPTIDKVITYLPDGFDEKTMIIAGNEAGYDGTFTAEVFLKDSANYVWDDGTVGIIEFEWKIGGVNTAFAALVTVLVLLAALGVGAGVAQYLLYKRKQKREAEAADEEDENPTETQEDREGGNQA